MVIYLAYLFVLGLGSTKENEGKRKTGGGKKERKGEKGRCHGEYPSRKSKKGKRREIATKRLNEDDFAIKKRSKKDHLCYLCNLVYAKRVNHHSGGAMWKSGMRLFHPL